MSGPPPKREPLARLRAAQRDARLHLPDVEPPSSVLPCGLPRPSLPCDLGGLVITERRTAVKHRAPWLGPDPDPPKERAHPARFEFPQACGPAGAPSGGVLAVVAGGPKDSRTTTLEIEVVSDYRYCGPALENHPHVVITRPGQPPETLRGRRRAVLPVHRPGRRYDALPRGAEDLVGMFWAWNLAPATCQIDAVVCGDRRDGRPLGSQRVVVQVYPDDAFELEISSPSLFKTALDVKTDGQDVSLSAEVEARLGGREVKAGSALTSEAGRRKLEASVTVRDDPSGTERAVTYTLSEGERGRIRRELEVRQTVDGVDHSLKLAASGARPLRAETFTIEPRTDLRDPRFEVALTRNGERVDVLGKTVALINLVRDLSRRLLALKDAIRDLKPRVGWDFNLEFALLAGVFKAAWGWKEYTDHRAWLACSFEVHLQVFKLEATLAFGLDLTVKGYGVVAKVEGTLEADFKVAARYERTSPDAGEFNPAKIEDDSTGALALKVMAGSPTVAEIKGEIETGFDCEGSLRVERTGPVVAVETIGFKGMKAKARVRILGWLNWKGELTLMDRRPIGGPLHFPE